MIFKRKSKTSLMIFIVLSCLTVIVASAVAYGQPGSDTDPLVTKSYVDQQIARLTTQLGGSVSTGTGVVDTGTLAQLQTDVGDLTKFVIDALSDIQTLKSRIEKLETGYVVVELDTGKTLLLSGGSEVILRGGTATALKGVNGDLLVDASAGKELANGVNVPLQHIIICSRTDGRGLVAKSKCYLLVRGAYTVK